MMSRPATSNPPKPEPAAITLKPASANAPMPTSATAAASPATAAVSKPVAEPLSKHAQEPVAAAPPNPASPAEPVATALSATAAGGLPKPAKRSFFERINPLNLFRSSDKTPVPTTPLEALARSPQNEPVRPGAAKAEPADNSLPVPPTKGPPDGHADQPQPQAASTNQSDAERSFAQGVQAYQAHRLSDAIQAYRLATQEDPGFFKAYYNLGLVATETGSLPLALTSYEKALAIQPASLDARYNYALVLKQANHPAEAMHELEKVLASSPGETRAHLALGNLYAQQFGQSAKARPHYLKVLELEPQHPQATAIRYWLAANPP